jgi:hypothetical protein
MLRVVLPPSGLKPVPEERLRDLLGLVRLLFALETKRGGDAGRLKVLGEAGQLLRVALDQSRCRPGTLGHRAAPMNVDKGIEALRGAGLPAEIAEIVELAHARLC